MDQPIINITTTMTPRQQEAADRAWAERVTQARIDRHLNKLAQQAERERGARELAEAARLSRERADAAIARLHAMMTEPLTLDPDRLTALELGRSATHETRDHTHRDRAPGNRT